MTIIIDEGYHEVQLRLELMTIGPQHHCRLNPWFCYTGVGGKFLLSKQRSWRIYAPLAVILLNTPHAPSHEIRIFKYVFAQY